MARLRVGSGAADSPVRSWRGADRDRHRRGRTPRVYGRVPAIRVVTHHDADRVCRCRCGAVGDRQNVGFPVRLLSIGLPLTVVLGTGVNLLLFGDWPVAEALLLAAILAPTDAALGSAVVSDPDVPHATGSR